MASAAQSQQKNKALIASWKQVVPELDLYRNSECAEYGKSWTNTECPSEDLPAHQAQSRQQRLESAQRMTEITLDMSNFHSDDSPSI